VSFLIPPRLRRVPRLVIVEVGEPALRFAAPRRISLLLPLLLILSLLGIGLLAAKVLVIPVLLGGPLLAFLATLLLLFLLRRYWRPRRFYLVHVNISASSMSDRFISYTPPGSAEDQHWLADQLLRAISELLPSRVLFNISPHPAWWDAIAVAVYKLGESSRLVFTPDGPRAPPLYALLAWDARVANLRSEESFLEDLISNVFTVILLDPRHVFSRDVLERLLDIIEEAGEELRVKSRGRVLVPVYRGELLWGMGELSAPVIACCPEGLQESCKREVLWLFGGEPEVIVLTEKVSLYFLALELPALYPPAPISYGLQLEVRRVGA
jgi:hypothetical protein